MGIWSLEQFYYLIEVWYGGRTAQTFSHADHPRHNEPIYVRPVK